MGNKIGYKKNVKEEKESEEKRMFSQATNLGTYVKTKKLLNYIQLADNYALGAANPI